MNRQENRRILNGKMSIENCSKRWKLSKENVVLNVVKCKARAPIVAFALIIILGAIHVSTVEGASPQNEQDTQTMNTASQIEDKRAAREYNFGLGKRTLLNALELRKFFQNNPDILYRLIPDQAYYIPDDRREFSYFGTKRSKPARFNFGLGKRSSFEQNNEEANDDNEEGIPDKRAAGRYQFGIGKRSPVVYSSNSDFDEYIKRRYSFGLGKR